MMTVPLRTVLRWLDDQQVHDEAECWVLGGDTVQPVTGVTWTDAGDMIVVTLPIWSEPPPRPLQYAAVRDTLLEHYSGGGLLMWGGHSDTYRGSYTVDPEKAVFFLFLPDSIQIVETHEEKMEQRKQQAKQLTRDIEREQNSWQT